MSYQVPPDLEQQMRDHLATGLYSNADDVVREAFRALQRQDDDVQSIQEALADLEAGDRGKPFDEFVEEFRQANRIPRDS